MERRIKVSVAVFAVILLVTVALYFLFPPTPVAAVLVGLLLGSGVIGIPISIGLAILTEPKLPHYTATQDGQWVAITDDAGETTMVDLLATFGQAAIAPPGRGVMR